MGDKIKTKNSPKIVVNIFRNYVLIKGNPYTFSILENNFLMNYFSMRNLQNQLVLIHGIPIYNKELPKCEAVCYFIFNYLRENKLKVFRWKLLHFIISTNKLLLKWKIMTNSLCNLCNTVEAYSHYFMTYIYLKKFFWGNKRSVKKT